MLTRGGADMQMSKTEWRAELLNATAGQRAAANAYRAANAAAQDRHAAEAASDTADGVELGGPAFDSDEYVTDGVPPLSLASSAPEEAALSASLRPLHADPIDLGTVELGQPLPSSEAGAEDAPAAAGGSSSAEQEAASAEAAAAGATVLPPEDVAGLRVIGTAADAAAAVEESADDAPRLLRAAEADASLVVVDAETALDVVYVPMVRAPPPADPAPQMLTLDVSLEAGSRDVVAVVFAGRSDAAALVALLGGAAGFTVADGVARTVVGMPPSVAAAEASAQGAALLCFQEGFAKKVGVRVGGHLDGVLSAMAGSRWAALVSAQLPAEA